jgi:seryl-tRNA synthetase
MLDINFIRENKDIVKKGVTNKQFDTSLVDRVLELDEKRRKLILEIEQLRAKRNKIADGKKFSEEGKIIKEQLKEKEPELDELGKTYLETLQKIPNLPSDKAPVGKNEKDNKEVRL